MVALEGSPEGMEWLRIGRMSPREVVDEWFENEHVKALVLHHLPIPRGVLPDYGGLGAVIPLVISQVEKSQMALGGSHITAHAPRVLLESGASHIAHPCRRSVKDERNHWRRIGRWAQVLARDGHTVDVKQTFLKMVSETSWIPCS
jgi:hypothetical protein